MAVRNVFPIGLPVADRSSPTTNVAEVSATARLNQHLGLGTQGEAPEQRHALKVNGKSRFRQMSEDNL
jgi:hypothetical protein